ncbi:MAG: 23S rRNA (adenine(2503)-C(2))-methyltransferase RlmN [Chloroflexi bacterium]|nr:23S rRNA (adenine(2503)-C(2))-methyltransferase RlmN [Chloroflexota bacterium]
MSRANLLELSLPQLTAFLAELGEPPYRARQVWSWLYKRNAATIEAMTDLPAHLRARLAERAEIRLPAAVREVKSDDGLTRKVLLKLDDGNVIESVLMLYDLTAESRERRTVCVSTQAGCAVGCPFCATGQMGFVRNLTSGEIVAQVLYFARQLLADQQPKSTSSPLAGEKTKEGESTLPITNSKSLSPSMGENKREGEQALPVTNIVFMGMGEPLLNYANLWQAIERLHDPQGIALGARRMTISTSGIVPGILALAKEKLQVNLAVSLHAPNDKLRDVMVPINKKYPIADLMTACRAYIEATKRRITFEYVLNNNVNDSPELARELGELLRGMLCHVNLIPVNSTDASFSRPKRDAVIAFQRIVEGYGIATTVRVEKGVEIRAACGQLSTKHREKERVPAAF